MDSSFLVKSMEKLYACEEHMDEAMDEVIDGKETYPVINEITGYKCTYCEKEAKYEVKMA